MSVEKSQNSIRLNIPFQLPFEKTLKKTCNDFTAIDMSSSKSTDINNKGLQVETNAENEKCEYNENGTLRNKKILDPKTKALLNEIFYDEQGKIISEDIYTEDGCESILYLEFEKQHIFSDREKTKIYSAQSYDYKNRLTRNCTYNQETGNLDSSTSYDPETGDIVFEEKYDNNGNIIKQSFLNQKYIQEHYTYEYNDKGNKTKTNHYDENMKLLDTTINENGKTYKNYYDKNGQISRTTEIILGEEIDPLATEIYNNLTTENIKKINEDNVINVIDDFQVKNDENLMDGDEGFQDTLLDKILQNPNQKEKEEQLNHISSMIKAKFTKARNNSIELYCNDMKAVDKSIEIINKRLDKFSTDSAEEIRKTYNIASNMLKNNDLFIDVANGQIDKANYQGKTGDCWLLATINSIAESKNGKKLIENCLEVDPKTHDIKVKLLGGKKEYTITNEELQYSCKLSKGDYDLRAIELAFEKHLSEANPPQNLNGGFAYKALEILTGNNAKIAFMNYNRPDTPIEIEGEILDKQNIKRFKNTPLIIANSPGCLDKLQELQPNVAICTSAATSEYMSHQYWITIDGDNIIVKEPHNSENSKIYTREEFQNKFDGMLNIMIL